MAPTPLSRWAATSTVTLGLQGFTVLAKAGLLVLLARFLTPREVGVFGLVVASLVVALYAAGLDFYAFSTREILRVGPQQAARLFRDQLAFHGVAYLLVLPALLAVFAAGFLPWRLAPLFYLLTVVEHLGQELQRLLVTLSRPRSAATTAFLRGGAWVPLLFVLFLGEPRLRNVDTVLATWLGGSLVALLVAAFRLRDLEWGRTRRYEIDLSWLGRGLKVALPLLLGTLALRGIFTVDRFSLEAVRTTAEVGVYTFFISGYAAFQGFVEMGVLMIHRPGVIRAFQAGRRDDYRRRMRHLALHLGVLMALLVTAAALLIGPVLEIIGREIYDRHIATFWWVLALAVVAALAELPHLALYARHRDRSIVGATLVGLGLALLLDPLLAHRAGPAGVAAATLAAIASTGLIKSLLLRGRTA